MPTRDSTTAHLLLKRAQLRAWPTYVRTYVQPYVLPRTHLPTCVHGLQVEAVTKGDASVYCIAAASIIAKVGPTG